MMPDRRSLLRTGVATATIAPLAGALCVAGRAARAQAANTVKVGVLTDMSGPYRDLNGPASVACARAAVQEFGPRGFSAELVFADHQNRPDVAVNLARQWFDRDGVDMVVNLAASSVALALAELTREKNKVAVATSTATSDLTGRACTPNTVHWVFDTYMLARSTGGATVRAGGDSWFFITADYAFGHALERDTTSFARAQGVRTEPSTRPPALRTKAEVSRSSAWPKA